MRAFFSLLLLALLGVAQALSYTGRRLLVVIEDASEKDKYSKFWGDLECMLMTFVFLLRSRQIGS